MSDELVKRLREADELAEIGLLARQLMRGKGSYDCKVDERVEREYQAAYALIQFLADKYGPKEGHIIDGELGSPILPSPPAKREG